MFYNSPCIRNIELEFNNNKNIRRVNGALIIGQLITPL